MQFVYFHLMPWPYLDESFESERSAWVTYSNANFDPERGAEVYEQYLSQLVYAEELGFDAIAVNEHHQTAYGLMPSPDVIASYLVARTQRAKIAILGNATPLRDHPLRVAEEVAMMDVTSSCAVPCLSSSRRATFRRTPRKASCAPSPPSARSAPPSSSWTATHRSSSAPPRP